MTKLSNAQSMFMVGLLCVMASNLLAITPFVGAQTVESRLAALEKLPPQERQQRLYESAKSEGEAVIYANMDVSAMKPLTEGFMKRYPARKRPAFIFP